jgi:hypothetical protein
MIIWEQEPPGKTSRARKSNFPYHWSNNEPFGTISCQLIQVLVFFPHTMSEEMEGYQHAMAKPTLLPGPTCLHLQFLDASEATITAMVTTTSEEALCPLCHRHSTRIHSRYMRTVADLPWMGCAVRLELHVRRFFCTNQECTRQIFTERLPSVVASSARKTLRLTDVFTLIGFALGGEAGKPLDQT